MFAEARCKPWRGEADRVAQPPPWRFQDAGQTKTLRQYDHDGGLRARDKPCGSRYRPPRRSDQCASITRLSSGQRAIRSAGIASSARALPHLRPRHRRTSHPVAAYRGGHQNSSYSRSSGSKERNQSLSRHLAARTLCGSLAEIRQGSASLADGGVLL